VAGGEGRQGALTGLDVLQVTMRGTGEGGSPRQFPKRKGARSQVITVPGRADKKGISGPYITPYRIACVNCGKVSQ
jgi:hypothetical protein